jgi:hypothetical protein
LITGKGDKIMRETMVKLHQNPMSLYENIIQEIVCCFYIKGYSQDDLMILGFQYLDKLSSEYDLKGNEELIKSKLSSGFLECLQKLMERVVQEYFK